MVSSCLWRYFGPLTLPTQRTRHRSYVCSPTRKKWATLTVSPLKMTKASTQTASSGLPMAAAGGCGLGVRPGAHCTGQREQVQVGGDKTSGCLPSLRPSLRSWMPEHPPNSSGGYKHAAPHGHLYCCCPGTELNSWNMTLVILRPCLFVFFNIWQTLLLLWQISFFPQLTAFTHRHSLSLR